jgi:DNA-binding transcriptional LysR family regulator
VQWVGVELRHFLALEAVASESSFIRAAAKLGYTQSAVSQQIAALERAVGEQLVERPGGSRPVHLTRAGEILRDHASAIGARLSTAQADLRALATAEYGPLRIGTFHSVGALVLPPILRRFTIDRPDADILIVEKASDAELLELVAAGELDLSLLHLPLPEGFEHVRLLEDEYVLAVPEGSPLVSASSPPGLEELAAMPLGGYKRCRASQQVSDYFRASGLEPNFVFRVDDGATLQGLVASGFGVALIPRLSATALLPEISIVELGGLLPPRQIAIAWSADRMESGAADAFVAAAVAASARLSPARLRAAS